MQNCIHIYESMENKPIRNIYPSTDIDKIKKIIKSYKLNM